MFRYKIFVSHYAIWLTSINSFLCYYKSFDTNALSFNKVVLECLYQNNNRNSKESSKKSTLKLAI